MTFLGDTHRSSDVTLGGTRDGQLPDCQITLDESNTIQGQWSKPGRLAELREVEGAGLEGKFTQAPVDGEGGVGIVLKFRGGAESGGFQNCVILKKTERACHDRRVDLLVMGRQLGALECPSEDRKGFGTPARVDEILLR